MRRIKMLKYHNRVCQSLDKLCFFCYDIDYSTNVGLNTAETNEKRKNSKFDEKKGEYHGSYNKHPEVFYS